MLCSPSEWILERLSKKWLVIMPVHWEFVGEGKMLMLHGRSKIKALMGRDWSQPGHHHQSIHSNMKFSDSQAAHPCHYPEELFVAGDGRWTLWKGHDNRAGCSGGGGHSQKMGHVGCASLWRGITSSNLHSVISLKMSEQSFSGLRAFLQRSRKYKYCHLINIIQYVSYTSWHNCLSFKW